MKKCFTLCKMSAKHKTPDLPTAAPNYESDIGQRTFMGAMALILVTSIADVTILGIILGVEESQRLVCNFEDLVNDGICVAVR
jgi:hypothetical protein